MNRFMKRTAGFSLLELMVVVAIIGVLATFAVPRFNVIRARARQGEAKSNLGVIFTLQEAFKIEHEKYYDGKKATWGGADMDSAKKNAGKFVGYKGGGNSVCEANKMGFRLANCNAARYRYWIESASEFAFLAGAKAESDSDSRIFPGCQGIDTTKKPSESKSGKKKCQTATFNANTGKLTFADITTPIADMDKGGDAFCLDQSRTVDNFRDIVGDPACVN